MNNADGSANECKEQFHNYVMGTTWTCNSQWALAGAPVTDPNIGPIYPMEFSWPTCVKNDADENTRTCHCSENGFILGSKPIADYMSDEEKFLQQKMRDYWGQFMRDGTFPVDADFGEMRNVKNLNGELNHISKQL